MLREDLFGLFNIKIDSIDDLIFLPNDAYLFTRNKEILKSVNRLKES